MEKDLGISSSLVTAPMMGNILALAKSQTGFMSLFAIPLFKACSEVLPALQFTVDELSLNIHKWTLTIKDCEDRNISVANSPNPQASESSDELEITLHHPSGNPVPSFSSLGAAEFRVLRDSIEPIKGSESLSHRSSYEWSDRSGQSSVTNRANARSSTSSPFYDSRPPSGPQDNSRRSSTTVPSDIPLDCPLIASSNEPSIYKGSPAQAQTPPYQVSNGSYLRPKKDKALYAAFPPPPSTGMLGVSPPFVRPRSSPPDLGEANEKCPALAVTPHTVERRPSRFFKKFWNKKKHREES